MSTSTLKEVSHIAKYDGKNFSLWKLGLWVLLEQHELIKIVTGDEKIPEEVRPTQYFSFQQFLLYLMITPIGDGGWTSTES